MIALNQQSFSRAVLKAGNVKPSVTHQGAAYTVSRSDGGQARVKFTARANQLWASCDCLAGSPAGNHTPLPCYHVGAVLLLSAVAARREHKHQCPRCNSASIYSCNCATPETPDYDCDCLYETADHRDSDYWA